MIRQHQAMFVEFTEFLGWNYTITRKNSDLNKFSQYSYYSEICFPSNFDVCWLNLFKSVLKDGTLSVWQVGDLRRAYLKELEANPVKLDRYHDIFDPTFEFAQTCEEEFPKASRKLYELLAYDTY